MTSVGSGSIGTGHVDRNMDLVSKLYQRSLYPSVLEVARGNRLETPLVVDLDPTTVCDLACPECISGGLLNQGQIGKDRIVELAQELAASNVRAVVLIGGGEPLLHRSIGTVIDTLFGAGIHIGLTTNGTMIDRYLDQIAEKVAWTRVSMDAANEVTYPKFRPAKRGRRVFPSIIGNMRWLAARKRGRLGYSYLLMQRLAPDGSVLDTNYHEVLEAARLAKDIGCDYFEVKTLVDDDHYTLNQRAEDIAVVERQLEQVRALTDDGFHLLVSNTWDKVRAAVDSVEPKNYHTCPTTELRTTITTSGVYVCPYHRGNPAGRIGDISRSSLAEIWQKADTTIIDPARDCRFICSRHPTNLEIQRMRPDDDVELLDDYDPFF
ncbi:radical SAM protein [Actinoplanes sp. NPDC051475]|uniref:radical SAM protein n=1 Tax=Actinoplanes sp. NPDC051475 TaxID=3157225 RepID=UPI00344CDF10